MDRRSVLSATGVVITVGLGGCAGDTNSTDSDERRSGNTPDEDESNGGSAQASVEWNYKEYDEVRFPSMSEGVSFQSDSEDKYVGVELRTTNQTDETQSFADGYATGVYLTTDINDDYRTARGQSEFSTLESVPAGETVDTTLLYAVSPDASSYSLETTPEYGTVETYSISRDEQLAVGLIDLSDSS